MKNRVVVIPGSARGLGYAIAEATLKAGATVVIIRALKPVIE